MSRVKKLIKYFSNPKRLTILNICLLIVAILTNVLLQVFCIPTNWVIIVLAITFGTTVSLPLKIDHGQLTPIISIINGFSFCLFIYSIIFLEHANLWCLLFLIPGFLIFTPYFFAIQLFRFGFLKHSNKIAKRFFVVGVLISMTLLITSGIQFEKAIKDIDNFKRSKFQTLNKTFMTEKILGMGIIYHTSFCEYDGWRPPLHEPILVLELWMNNRKNPLDDISLEKRVELYKRFFPNKKVKYDCSCAISYGSYYHNDKLWK